MTNVKSISKNSKILKISNEAKSNTIIYSGGCTYSSSGSHGGCCQSSSSLSGY